MAAAHLPPTTAQLMPGMGAMAGMAGMPAHIVSIGASVCSLGSSSSAAFHSSYFIALSPLLLVCMSGLLKLAVQPFKSC